MDISEISNVIWKEMNKNQSKQRQKSNQMLYAETVVATETRTKRAPAVGCGALVCRKGTEKAPLSCFV